MCVIEEGGREGRDGRVIQGPDHIGFYVLSQGV